MPRQSKRKKLECKVCRIKFYPIYGRDKIQKYCSKECWYKDKNKPKIFKPKLSIETKLKIKKSLLNTYKSEIVRNKLSRIMKIKACRGEKHIWWKNGSSQKYGYLWNLRRSTNFKNWRNKVFKRDNWTCQKYKSKGGQLEPHHIKNFSEYPKLRFKVSNGMTLSKKAHREFHKKYGKTKNNMTQLKEFISKY